MFGYQENDVAAKELSNVMSDTQFRRSQSKQLWTSYKQCGCAPARGIFGYVNNQIILIIREEVLEQREKTLSEIAHDVYTETGAYFALASIFSFRLEYSSTTKVIIQRETFTVFSSSSLSRLRR